MILLCTMMIFLCVMIVMCMSRLLRASPSPKQKRKSSTASSIEAPNRSSAPNKSSAPKRAKTPQLLPNEMTDEQKAFLAPKKPQKFIIPPHTVKHFAETRQKRAELRTDYDRPLSWIVT
jgi:hypothetical protein